MKFLDSISLIIPAYNPDYSLVSLVDQLSRRGFYRIIVINDGSDQSNLSIFLRINNIKKVTLLHHKRNLGKGAALKTGFRYITENLSHMINMVITLDADGQHNIEDVMKIANISQEFLNCLILGVRDFSGSVPLRSKFGNKLTKRVLKLIANVDLNDTQTGLRGIPTNMLREALKISSNRYEFELECILLAERMGLKIIQIPVKTIYVNNKLSYFRPLIDSMRIYLVFIRFVSISIISFFVDIIAFTLFYLISSDIIISTYSARLLSGSVNFSFNKYAVFRSHSKNKLIKESLSYVGLAILIATMSAIVVNHISVNIAWNVVVIKVIVDLHLFIISFLIQRFIIFRFK